jgi:hypothetical protein
MLISADVMSVLGLVKPTLTSASPSNYHGIWHLTTDNF